MNRETQEVNTETTAATIVVNTQTTENNRHFKQNKKTRNHRCRKTRRKQRSHICKNGPTETQRKKNSGKQKSNRRKWKSHEVFIKAIKSTRLTESEMAGENRKVAKVNSSVWLALYILKQYVQKS